MSIKLIQLLSLSAIVFFSSSIFAKLSDYQKFVSFPYLEKAYRLQSAGRYSDAIRELKLAINVAPEHQPYQILLFELLVADNQLKHALDLYESLPNSSKGSLLASIIETQIQEEKFELTDEIKILIEKAPIQDRHNLYRAVAGRLIAKGQESLIYNWLSMVNDLPPELQVTLMRLADKQGKYQSVVEYYYAISAEDRSSDADRLYAFSLLRLSKQQEALSFANQSPTSQLSFDIYYQFLQESIAKEDAKASNEAFEWIEKHHQLTPSLLEQRFEQSVKSKDRQVAFAVMSQLNSDCQKRIEVALSFEWKSKAVQQLLICQDTMQESLWLTYAGTLLSDKELRQLINEEAKYSKSISKILIDRYIAKEQYQQAVDEINRAKLTNSYGQKLALSYEKLGQLELATEQFIALYNTTNNDAYLDKSSFLLVQQNKNLEALALIEKRLVAAPQSIPKNLIERIMQIYQQHPNKLSTAIITSLSRTNYARDTTAEILRINGQCSTAIQLLNKGKITTAMSWATRAQCVTQENPEQALQYWQNAYAKSQSPATLRAIAFAEHNVGNSEEALKSLEKLGTQNWKTTDTLFAAQLYFQQQDYVTAEQYWLSVENNTESWFDLGIDLAIQQQRFSKAQELSNQLLDLNGQFNAQQWARQALIYQQTKQNDKASRAWQTASEIEPKEELYQLSWAYSLIDSRPQKAYEIFRELTDKSPELDSGVWEQIGYLAASNNQQDAAVSYIKKSIETAPQSVVPRGEQSNWDLHQYYRDLSQNWHFNTSFSQGTGAILGEVFFENNGNDDISPPTNNLSSRAEYFFNTTNKKWSTYVQLSGNGTDKNPLSDWSQELGASYRIFERYNIKASIGAQRFFSGDWETIARLNGDLFNQNKWRQGWRFKDSWWQRQFYFDFLLLPESEQILGLGRFDIGYVEALSTASKQTLLYYGLAQHDIRKLQQGDPAELETYSQSSIGLGIKWSLFTTPDIIYDRVHSFSLALEWRLTVSGNLTNDNSSMFIIGSYQY